MAIGLSGSALTELGTALWPDGWTLCATEANGVVDFVQQCRPTIAVVVPGQLHALQALRDHAEGVPVLLADGASSAVRAVHGLFRPLREVLLRHATVNLGTREVLTAAGSGRLTRLEARLLHALAARPGQVLSSDELLSGVWGYRKGVRTNALGTTMHRLRRKVEAHPSEPEHLRTVPGGGYRFHPVSRLRSGTPAPRDRFVGRDADLAALRDALTRSRIVTVMGPGGVGKTRLCQELCHREAAPELPRRSLFVDLTEAQQREDLHAAAAAALELDAREDGALHIVRALVRRGPLLLVLDNVEQIVEVAASAVTEWVDEAPDLRVLCTSRVALQIRGEMRVPMAPLPLPASRHPDDVRESEAVELLLERAVAHAVELSVDAGNAATIADIVGAVDGLPLALEMLAPRLQTQGPAELSAALEGSLGVVQARDRDRPARHRELERTLWWSWELLPLGARRALARASVFEGGFSATAAREVIGEGADDLLCELVNHSLARCEPTPYGQRFGLLRTVHAFATARLDELGERTEAQQLHTDWVLALNLPEPAWAPGPEEHRADLPNALVAGERMAHDGRWDVAASCALASWAIAIGNGPYRRLMRLLTAVAERVEDARVLLALGCVSAAMGRLEDAVLPLERALGLARARGTLDVQIRAQTRLGQTYAIRQRHGGGPDLRAALQLAQQHGLEPEALPAAALLAQVLVRAGDLSGAEETLAWVLRSSTSCGDELWTGRALCTQAVIEAHRARADRGSALLQEAIPLLERCGARHVVQAARVNLASMQMRLGHFGPAFGVFEAQRRMAADSGRTRDEAGALVRLGIACVHTGQLANAEDHLHEAVQRCRVNDIRDLQASAHLYLGICRRLAGRNAEARALLERVVGTMRDRQSNRELSLALSALALCTYEPIAALARADEAVETCSENLPRANALLARARVHIRQDRFEEARHDLDAARDAPLPPYLRGHVHCVQALLHHANDRPDQARACWSQAVRHAAALGAGSRSDLGRLITRIESVLPG